LAVVNERYWLPVCVGLYVRLSVSN